MTYKCNIKFVKNSNFEKIIRYLPEFNLTKGPWIAGGAARLLWHREEIGDHDIDIFFANEDQWNKYIKTLEGLTSDNAFVTKNASTFNIKVEELTFKIQLIKKNWYKDYEDIFNSFDFTCCQFVTDGKNIIATEDAVNDCKKKIMRFNANTTREFDSRRAIKYSLYGFTPDKNILTQIIKLSNTNTLSSNWSQNEY